MVVGVGERDGSGCMVVVVGRYIIEGTGGEKGRCRLGEGVERRECGYGRIRVKLT